MNQTISGTAGKDKPTVQMNCPLCWDNLGGISQELKGPKWLRVKSTQSEAKDPGSSPAQATSRLDNFDQVPRS